MPQKLYNLLNGGWIDLSQVCFVRTYKAAQDRPYEYPDRVAVTLYNGQQIDIRCPDEEVALLMAHKIATEANKGRGDDDRSP